MLRPTNLPTDDLKAFALRQISIILASSMLLTNASGLFLACWIADEMFGSVYSRSRSKHCRSLCKTSLDFFSRNFFLFSFGNYIRRNTLSFNPTHRDKSYCHPTMLTMAVR